MMIIACEGILEISFNVTEPGHSSFTVIQWELCTPPVNPAMRLYVTSLPTAGWLPPVPAFTIVFLNVTSLSCKVFRFTNTVASSLPRLFSLCTSELRYHPAELVCVVLMLLPENSVFDLKANQNVSPYFDGRGNGRIGRKIRKSVCRKLFSFHHHL